MTDDLTRLVRDLTDAQRAVTNGARRLTQKGSLNIKNAMIEDAQGIKHAPHFPRSITYETRDLPGGGAVGIIGPDKDRTQGALGNILYYGTSKNAPVLDIGVGLEAEAPRLERALADLAAEALE